MSETTHSASSKHQHQKQSQSKSQSKSYGKVWLFFVYYWIIFGIGCYFGQYLPMSWRQPLSFALLVLVLITLFVKRARKYGIVISHIYTIVLGLLSYALRDFYVLLTKLRS